MIETVDCKCTMFTNLDLSAALREAAAWLITQKAQKKPVDVLEITVVQPDDHIEEWFVNLYW